MIKCCGPKVEALYDEITRIVNIKNRSRSAREERTLRALKRHYQTDVRLEHSDERGTMYNIYDPETREWVRIFVPFNQ